MPTNDPVMDDLTISKEEVTALFKLINIAFPKFNSSADVHGLWFRLLNKIGATEKEAKRAVEYHILESQFEPKLADIATRVQAGRGYR